MVASPQSYRHEIERGKGPIARRLPGIRLMFKMTNDTLKATDRKRLERREDFNRSGLSGEG